MAPPWLPVPPPAYGGTEGVVAVLARGLAERGHQVSVAAVAGSSLAGVDVLSTLDAAPPEIGQSEPEWEHLLRAMRHVEHVAPDVVIDHTGPLGAMLLSGAGRPSLHVAHGRLDGITGQAYAAVAGRDARLRLVAISRSQRDLAPSLPFTGMCHNGIVVEDAPFGRRGHGYLLFVGRMSPDKGVDSAIDIAQAAGRPLVIAAKCSEPEERRYFDRVVAPRIGPGVDWVGEVDAGLRFRLMCSADALLFPIRWPEPFGMVMIEAMACGAPVLATHEGAVPEVVSDGETGFVREHPMDLVDCVGRLHEIDRRACRRHVAEHFSHRQVAAAYEHLAMELIRA